MERYESAYLEDFQNHIATHLCVIDITKTDKRKIGSGISRGKCAKRTHDVSRRGQLATKKQIN